MNRRLILLIILICIMPSTYIISQEAPQNGFKMPSGPSPDTYSHCWTDVNYAGDGKEFHNLDIYLPKHQQSTYQAIILIYGSAWFADNAKVMATLSIGTPLLEAGFAVVSINHRSSSEAPWPAQIQDVKAAIRFIRANASLYQIDPSFIGISGFSSGGHLSTFAAVTNDDKTLISGDLTIDIEGNIGDYLTTSSKVDAVVDWFGPVDMAHMDNDVQPKDANSPEAVLIGGKDPRTEPDWIRLISPINFVDKTDVPILIIHGDSDNVVPQSQSIHLKTAFDYAGAKATFISVPGGGHGPGCFDQKYFQMMIDFFSDQCNRK